MDHEWLKLVEFGSKAESFNTDKNKVIDVMDVFKAEGGRDKTPGVRLLSHLNSEFSFFTLGPVYTTCNVPFDIFGEYRAMREANGDPYEGPRLVMRFKKPVFTGMQEWDYMLEAMNNGKDFEDFKTYCITQAIRVRSATAYWRIAADDILAYDPLAVDDSVVNNETKIIVTTFLPAGNMYRLCNTHKQHPPYDFKRVAPRPEDISEAGVMLQI